MNTLIPIIVIAVISILIFCLYMAIGKIKDLEKAKRNLREESEGLKMEIKRLEEE